MPWNRSGVLVRRVSLRARRLPVLSVAIRKLTLSLDLNCCFKYRYRSLLVILHHDMWLVLTAVPTGSTSSRVKGRKKHSPRFSYATRPSFPGSGSVVMNPFAT